MTSYLTAYHKNGKLCFEIYYHRTPYKSRDDWSDKQFTGIFEIDIDNEGKSIDQLITDNFHNSDIQKMLTANSKVQKDGTRANS